MSRKQVKSYDYDFSETLDEKELLDLFNKMMENHQLGNISYGDYLSYCMEYKDCRTRLELKKKEPVVPLTSLPTL